jgi:hypothetical protein
MGGRKARWGEPREQIELIAGKGRAARESCHDSIFQGLSLTEYLLKSEATQDVVDAVQAIEDKADLCFQELHLLRRPWNLGCWALLSRIVVQIEQTIEERGYRTQTQAAVMYNLARGGAQAVAWIAEHGNPQSAVRKDFVFSPELFEASGQALWAAASYESFTTVFPLWHKLILRAELVKGDLARFGGEDEHSRRVRAYLQGLRPAADRETPMTLGNDLEPAVKRKIQNIVQNASGGQLSFSYGNPSALYRQLYERYFDLSASQFRHSDSLLVGTYTLGDFRRLFSALLAVCAVHEHACFLRYQLTHKFPSNSGVMVRYLKEWVKLLSKISLLPRPLVADIVGDLVFGATRTLDMYVHPFVPLDRESQLLGIVPHFPTKSRSDENIFRVCSHLRPALYDAITSAKEEQMRGDLQARAYSGFRIRGPRLLPGGLPDIDLIIEDASTSTVVIAELKWLRKSIRSVEHIAQEAAFLRGVDQLESVRAFLQSNPRFLMERDDVSEDLSKFRNVHYVLVPRDYFIWIDPTKGFPVIDYDAFSRTLAQCDSLAEAMDQLLTFDWLPLEGRDFGIKYETFTVNGVSVETEVIYASY